MNGDPATAAARAARLALMAFDVDGVLTDGTLEFGSQGDEIKAFSSLDGHGLKMLQRAGIDVAIISGRESPALELRAKNLGISELNMGVEDKRAVMTRLAARRGIELAQTGYMGDDVVDLRCCAPAAFPRRWPTRTWKSSPASITSPPGGVLAVRYAKSATGSCGHRANGMHPWRTT